jgi:phosphate transport system protein
MEHLDMELAALKQKLLTMASHAEGAVKGALRALTERNTELALRVKDEDAVLDRMEVEIDDTAIHILAKAPLAGDLRFVTVVMKISQNLERVGDEAAKIAKRARDLSGEPPLKLKLELDQMAELVLAMLKDALDAFVNRDAAAARALIPRDKQVNQLNKELNKRVFEHISGNPEAIKRGLHLIVVFKSLERIGDHAKNMAEDIVYLCEAQDIRHTPV